MRFLGVLLFSILNIQINSKCISIDHMGAISDNMKYSVALRNSDAIIKAFGLLNKIHDCVYVPKKTYYISSTYIYNVTNANFIINGTIKVLDTIKRWPVGDDGKSLNILHFTYIDNFKISGIGTIDGQGYKWWWVAILSATGKTVDNRPYMLTVESGTNFEFSGVKLMNAPKFHVRLLDLMNVHMHHFEIDVDIASQRRIMSHVPTFPLNTDGIDPSVTNMHMHDFKIRCFDDAIAVKSCLSSGTYCKCASNITIENGKVINSVGLSIGSIKPKDDISCVDNVTFRNIEMEKPFKGIYVKTNRGNSGHGSITNILYENITIDAPVWWPIYIGPQQQKQPDGKGEGCMNYPLEDCPTEALVDIENITLRNIQIKNSVNPYSGVIRCNETNPCKGFVFDNVNVDVIVKKNKGYICENIEMKSYNSNPKPLC